MASERQAKRIILANTDEPGTGDYAYQLYDKAHPVFGDRDVIDNIRNQLRGLKGRKLVLNISGARIPEDGNPRRFNVRRLFTLNRYSDLFGPGSAYASAIHAIRERYSDETLVTYSLSLEIA